MSSSDSSDDSDSGLRVDVIRNSHFLDPTVSARASFKGFNPNVEKLVASVKAAGSESKAAQEALEEAVDDTEMMKRFKKYIGLRVPSGAGGGRGGGGGGGDRKKFGRLVNRSGNPGEDGRLKKASRAKEPSTSSMHAKLFGDTPKKKRKASGGGGGEEE